MTTSIKLRYLAAFSVLAPTVSKSLGIFDNPNIEGGMYIGCMIFCTAIVVREIEKLSSK